MEIKKYLDEFCAVDCDCGKIHSSSVKEIIVKSGAIKELPRLIRDYSAKKPFVLADINTFAVAGKSVLELLDGEKISCSSFVF